jgi:predicted RNase H-like nuclease (RuvC/YqgF family)
MMTELVEFQKMEKEHNECKEFVKSAQATIEKLSFENEQLQLNVGVLKQKNHELKDRTKNFEGLNREYQLEKRVSKRVNDESMKRALEIEELKRRLKEYEDDEEDPDEEIRELIEYED